MEKKKKVIILGIAIFIVLFIPLFYFIFSLQPVSQGAGTKKIVIIPAKASTTEIGALLEEKKLIRNGFTFVLYAKLKGAGSELKAGKYLFTVGQSAGEIINQIAQGKIYKDSFTLVVPEGFTVEQIAQRLADNGIVNKEAFLAEADSGDFSSYEFVKNIPADKKIKHRIEGYLFPDTYEIGKGATPHEIINLLLKREGEMWNPEWDVKLKSLNLTHHQVLTLASIVEREVKVKKEQPLVAGIYMNRLKINMALQADATLQYASGKQNQIDTQINSPYNTYKNPGIPPGPIANPGKAAIEAVLNPEKTNFLYYVTKNNGTGEHYFAATYTEHLANIRKSNANGK